MFSTKFEKLDTCRERGGKEKAAQGAMLWRRQSKEFKIHHAKRN